jgi:hypothetical protein
VVGRDKVFDNSPSPRSNEVPKNSGKEVVHIEKPITMSMDK